MVSAAYLLEGRILEEEWIVVSKVDQKDTTGGYFSVGYIIEKKDGTKAFLKALDLSKALTSSDPARDLQALVEGFNFERDLLQVCKEKRLSRVVQVVGEGVITVDDAPPPNKVQYLVLELASRDVRSQANILQRLDEAWSLRALHHVSTGLFQLHGQGIAHQDLKPSNVLVFDGAGSKITDLGRASAEGKHAPHDEYKVAGDLTYAPPELLYGFVDPDRRVRRYGCDAYLLGSLVFFFFTGSMITPYLVNGLRNEHTPNLWGGSFDDILPYLHESFGTCVEFFEDHLHGTAKGALVSVVKELGEPDPRLRGNPRTRASQANPFSLERYVSLFDLLAARAEAGLLDLHTK